MEGPLLSKSEHIVDTTLINGDSSPDGEHIVHITADANPPPTRKQIIQSEARAHAILAYIDATSEPACPNCCFGIEFVLTLVQIVVAIVVMTKLKEDEHPQTTLINHFIAYICGCIGNLPVLCCRLCSAISVFDPMYKWQMALEYYFVTWSLVLFWYFVTSSSTLNDTTQHVWLSLAFFAFIFIRYAIPNIKDLKYVIPLFAIKLVGDIAADLSPIQMVLVSIVYIILTVTAEHLCQP